MSIELTRILTTAIGPTITGLFTIVGIVLKHKLETQKKNDGAGYYDVTNTYLGKEMKPSERVYTIYPSSFFEPKSYRRWFVLAGVVALSSASYIYLVWFR